MHRLRVDMRLLRILACLLLVCPWLASAQDASKAQAAPANLRVATSGTSTTTIPRVQKEPPLEAFREMKPSPEWEGKLAKVADFVQRDPKDGAPPFSRTNVYMGYDDK